MGTYDRPIATALRQIKAKGEACKWVKKAVAASGGDSWNPQPGSPGVQHDVRIAFFSPRDLGMGSGQFKMPVDGTEVSASTQIGLMGAVEGFTPDALDTILRQDGKTVSISKLDFLAPNGKPILYYVTVRA